MTNKEIKKMIQEVYEIQSELNINKQFDLVKDFTQRVGALSPQQMVYFGVVNGQLQNAMTYEDKKKYTSESIRNIYLMLHTEEMFNACVYAKRSCFWAAIAAIASCISVLLVLFCA
jgi:hypothetical protein